MTHSETPCKKVLLLGSGALKIGEAGEFDYSGSQAIKALRQRGVEVVLVNPNIATYQTNPELADRIYYLPLRASFVEDVIIRERPEGILLAFGGQSALNCGLELHRLGILERYGVEVLGTPIETIIVSEDRARFADTLRGLDVSVPRSYTAETVSEALSAAEKLGFPLMLRLGFSLGGLGSGICRHAAELEVAVEKALAHAPQVLLEEYLLGWKEIEYEVVRDRFDNCLTVCNMENLDPMGVHTGDSVVVAPSQTLSNDDYHRLRSVALKVIRALGIIGECNIQFALDPHSEAYRVIEVNARLSRSSALASKATGYPLAWVAARLALGEALTDIVNPLNGVTPAFFEPALDYVVVKIPRWDLRKFRQVEANLGSEMKSVGEVMAIGRSFEEALQKALRMLDRGYQGLLSEPARSELSHAHDERLLAIASAFRQGRELDEIQALTRIDAWFLAKIQRVVSFENQIKTSIKSGSLDDQSLREAKRLGFSDRQLAALTGQTVAEISKQRHRAGIRPWLRQIDSLAAEYPSSTNYLYLSYQGQSHDLGLKPPERPRILILGSGPYCIGSSVEFDWCCVNSAQALRTLGYETVILNCNPETVSTDYDLSDMLLFEEISLETITELQSALNFSGVIVSVGGQIANRLAPLLSAAGCKVLGTAPENIHTAEDRERFSSLLQRLNIDQPPWRAIRAPEQALAAARELGYPLMVRPSYVLSGTAMWVAHSEAELLHALPETLRISGDSPAVLSRFITGAREFEFDGVAQHGQVLASAVCEHLEPAGIHSGDASLIFPPRVTDSLSDRLARAAAAIAEALQIHGPFNIQFLQRGDELYVIECNLRASRSFPFVSKCLRQDLIALAARTIVASEPLPAPALPLPGYVGVKLPQFSFSRLKGADPVLGVEMASTGEVGCLGRSLEEAFYYAACSVGYSFDIQAVLLSSGPPETKSELLESVRQLQACGVLIYATAGTASHLEAQGLACAPVAWPLDAPGPLGFDAVECIRRRKVQLVINLPKNSQQQELMNDYLIRRAAVDHNLPIITTAAFARQFVTVLLERKRPQPPDWQALSWQEYR